MEWMLDIQLGRRNLSPIQRIAIAEKYRSIYEKQAKERQATSTGGANPQLTQNFVEADKNKNRSDNETNAKLAKIANVNRETYRQAKRVLDSDNEDLKQRVLSGETAISKGHRKMKESEKKKIKQQLKEELFKLIFSVIQELLKTFIIAILTTFFVFFANIIYKKLEGIKNTNEIIKSMSLGESKKYINSLLGIPRFEFIDNDLCNSFYPLDYIIVRCVFDEDGLLVGFFVTAKQPNYKIEFIDPINAKQVYKFGKDTIADSSLSDAIIKANVGVGSGGISKSFYWEYNYLFGVGNHKGFIVAILPYGFIESESYNLMFEIGVEPIDTERINHYRKIFCPNTYGIIDSNYENLINPYIENSEKDVLWAECVNNLIND